jgi:hypothetical protein
VLAIQAITSTPSSSLPTSSVTMAVPFGREHLQGVRVLARSASATTPEKRQGSISGA